MNRCEELLEAEARGWDELDGAIRRLADDELERPGVTPEWTVKDLMWHVARWSEDCVLALEQIRAGTFTGVTITEDTETVNRRWLAESRRRDLGTVKAEWVSARARMVERFAGLEPCTPEAEEWFEEAGRLHYAKHLADLRAWLASRT